MIEIIVSKMIRLSKVFIFFALSLIAYQTLQTTSESCLMHTLWGRFGSRDYLGVDVSFRVKLQLTGQFLAQFTLRYNWAPKETSSVF